MTYGRSRGLVGGPPLRTDELAGRGDGRTFGPGVVPLPGETVTSYTGDGDDIRTDVYQGRSTFTRADTGTVSLRADSGERATTRLYDESSVVTDPG
jgi:hypothetical protein